ncbi:bifunctional (p)ppGpp synthetase/guanosine-3',5'-bis(diphosphate) 3'-pyrophosphohydrolase [Peptoniphilus lacrimalis]|uniref:RelA/SpoT family protein n=1 Tax=Peptoniphilus lacrimalis TaxID=33031 RepID=UPI00254E939A|nr:bifunctional (p)ppGpp synthetase/guanosine-3',5'-bis(diphosphate) 3'-pyrophosphohydrolase [Peptoniphilus lacrimalis]MDK7721971.1 bifunctional (p)ppGpp synthetase/guanosine-3',5'-bis(diphosphate) 3'-pyrophosphohydrolase [Peptoniphilus lacrimalis]MDK7731783.1 bifunctional (p)ppGpp synthetase/guanosine-3',5'-bis(diphosphate) 3'-pyrophosphohydrolase [Peptoniphilus lacrimalis]MDK8282108.1 bifunctional (p)ppGpp synthetase/guanosine-3',5'-bis(diphosphate) 3'-pyrophosphohydrolase [Peptoniphilus lacri
MTIDDLIEKIKTYNPNVDEAEIRSAYELAKVNHQGQKRNSGEDYIIHPLHVAMILADMNMDSATIIAGLLHDTIEDTSVTYEDIEKKFGKEIAELVDGVTKLKKLNYKSKAEKQAENIRKMVLAMAKDIRVIIVKLADRLHNMRTLEYMTEAKKIEKATETLEIYAPIADRLGMSRVKWELEDLSLRYLDPDEYYKLVDMVNKRRKEREELINSIIDTLKVNLERVGIKCEINGRPKNFYSIYKKMKVKGKVFDEIYDLSAVRILTNDIKDCYGALGVVHTLWKPIPGRFKDYIAMPKPNNYQSLHTTVIDNNGETFEVQIRTYQMHQTAEYGIAAHWKYKTGQTKTTSFDENLTWLRQLMEWQKDLNDPNDFMDTLKVDFFADEVFVFSPKGDVINLPEGSTPIDFAYRIHTQVGNTCVGAKVNGRIVPLSYKLSSGNIVDIITNSNSGPSLDWLNIVKSNQAKKKISQYFKIKDRDKNIEKGKEILEKEAKRLNYNVNEFLKDEWIDEVRAKLNVSTIDDLYAALGFGTVKLSQVTAKLIDIYNRFNKKPIKNIVKSKRKVQKSGIDVKGVDGVKVRIAKCCTPVPGDDIIGYITIGRGISVHRADCPNVNNNVEESRIVQVSWQKDEANSYEAAIEVRALDKPNVIGDVANRINEAKLNMTSLNARSTRDGDAIVDVILEITNIDELEGIIEKLKRVKNVFDVYRMKA